MNIIITICLFFNIRKGYLTCDKPVHCSRSCEAADRWLPADSIANKCPDWTTLADKLEDETWTSVRNRSTSFNPGLQMK